MQGSVNLANLGLLEFRLVRRMGQVKRHGQYARMLSSRNTVHIGVR